MHRRGAFLAWDWSFYAFAAVRTDPDHGNCNPSSISELYKQAANALLVGHHLPWSKMMLIMSVQSPSCDAPFQMGPVERLVTATFKNNEAKVTLMQEFETGGNANKPCL